MSWLFKSNDEKETKQLLAQAAHLRASSRFTSVSDAREFVIDLLVEVCEASDLCIGSCVAEPLAQIVLSLLLREPFLYDPDLARNPVTLKDGVNLRARLQRTALVLSDEAQHLDMWRDAMKAVLLGIVADLPVEALVDPYADGSLPHQPVLSGQRPLSEMVGDLPHMLTCFYGTFCAADISDAGLFYDLSLMLDNRLCIASGVPWVERFKHQKKMKLPIDRRELLPSELASLYLDDTPFEGFFDTKAAIPVPNEVRFEHTHIVGGTGHGKTQLLQYLLMDDLKRALDSKMSVVVLDPDGTLIRTISGSAYFKDSALGDRAIFIDPTDAKRPIGLNLFDVSHLEGADTRTRESIENNTIELFEYFFDALLGSELTGKQTTLFRYLGLLLMQIPGGNIHTLRELMEDGKRFKPYMEQLSGSARTFFETRFWSKDVQATKSQVLSRLWAVLSNRSLDRVFSATRNSLDLDQALQDGTFIFVHTAKENLGEEGSAIFARMMVALLGQSLIRRAAIAPKDRTPTYLYLDEAEGVIDQTLVRLLAQCRKYRGAITLAHQHLDQLGSSARAGVLANTSIKLAGGISAKDAAALAPEFRTRPETLLSFKKDKVVSRFALFAKNYTETALQMSVPLGFAEGFERLDGESYSRLIERSRARYGYDPSIVERVPETRAIAPVHAMEPLVPFVPVVLSEPLDAQETPEPVVRNVGGGGARHQAICQTIKALGEAGGFRASIEETILDGNGRVDVILRQGARAMAFEVSVTTSREHELHNVKKCLSAGFSDVNLVAAQERHRLSLERYMDANLSSDERKQVRVVLADELGALFESDVPVEQAEKVVRGYRVRSKTGAANEATRRAVSDALSELFL